MTEFDKWIKRIQDLESELNKLRFRVGRIEDTVEHNMDPKPIKVEVVPPRMVAVAAEMGATMNEAKNITRSSKESARSLRRVVSPEDDTGQHSTADALTKPSK